MRLWHHELLHLLPNSQLIAQWRECNLLIKDYNEDKKTNHILINYVWDYPIEHLYSYMDLVKNELYSRGFKVVSDRRLIRFFENVDTVFDGKHNKNYLLQCFMNLQEKFENGQKDFKHETYINLYNFVNKKLNGILNLIEREVNM